MEGGLVVVMVGGVFLGVGVLLVVVVVKLILIMINYVGSRKYFNYVMLLFFIVFIKYIEVRFMKVKINVWFFKGYIIIK